MNINVQMNPCFKEVDRSRKRYIVMKGSAGSGKSVDTAQNYILRLMQDKGRNLVAMRKSDISNRDSTFAELTGSLYRMFGDKYEQYWHINKSPMSLTFKPNGNQIIFRGMNDDRQREKLKSITFPRDQSTHIIKIAKLESDRNSVMDLDSYRKKVLRHEIIHAFLYESGMWNCSGSTDCWGMDETITDWIAIQSPKLFHVFKEADCL